MFNKKNESNKLFETDYKMNSMYKADCLLVARLARISKENIGSRPEITEIKYIFEPIIEDNKTRYREIFTGFLANDDKEVKYLLLPFIVDIELLTSYFPHTKGSKLHKLDLIWLLNEINNQQNINNKKMTFINQKY